MNRIALCSIALLVTLPSVFAQDKVARPRITDIAHVRLYVTNIAQSRDFYTNIIGLYPSASLDCPGGWGTCFSVGWGPVQQHVYLEQSPSPAPQNWLAEVGFATDDIPKMRRYLVAHGLTVGEISKGPFGSQHFELQDPEGNRIAFVGPPYFFPVKDQPASRVLSSHLLHAGFVVRDLKAESHFYEDILGFRLYWRGGFKDDGTDWYELQVPDGDNWIEYMLNIPAGADKKELGVQNHFSLGVPDIHAAEAKIKANGAASYDGPEVGRDGKWSLDLYDPDGTRVELMEFAPVQKPCCSEYTGPHPKP